MHLSVVIFNCRITQIWSSRQYLQQQVGARGMESEYIALFMFLVSMTTMEHYGTEE